MKKGFGFAFIFAMLGGFVLIAGCGGGKEGSLSEAFPGALIVSGVVSSEGSPAGGFSASILEGRRKGARYKALSSKYKAKIVVKTSSGVEITSTETRSLYVDSVGTKLSFEKVVFSLNEGDYDLAVELFSVNSAANADPFYKKYEHSTISGGNSTEKTDLTVTATDTAYALAYDEWKLKTGAPGMFFSDFTRQIPDVSTITLDILTVLDSLATAPPSETFHWTAARTHAREVASATMVPSVSTTDPRFNSFSGSYEGDWVGQNSSGSVNCIITSDGTLAGQVYDVANPDQVNTLIGTVSTGGTLSGTISYSNGNSSSLTGILYKDSSGNLSGSLNENFSDKSSQMVTYSLIAISNLASDTAFAARIR